MASNDVQDVRIESLESRIDKHDILFEKMASAQTEMMVSIAKLHSSVKILLLFVAAGMGMDFTGLI
tara:strand:+ start:1588 stop:1785 length:198 start_codon:yes stop_codon:yes gene_type:complete